MDIVDQYNAQFMRLTSVLRTATTMKRTFSLHYSKVNCWHFDVHHHNTTVHLNDVHSLEAAIDDVIEHLTNLKEK